MGNVPFKLALPIEWLIKGDNNSKLRAIPGKAPSKAMEKSIKFHIFLEEKKLQAHWY